MLCPVFPCNCTGTTRQSHDLFSSRHHHLARQLVVTANQAPHVHRINPPHEHGPHLPHPDNLRRRAAPKPTFTCPSLGAGMIGAMSAGAAATGLRRWLVTRAPRWLTRTRNECTRARCSPSPFSPLAWPVRRQRSGLGRHPAVRRHRSVSACRRPLRTGWWRPLGECCNEAEQSPSLDASSFRL